MIIKLEKAGERELKTAKDLLSDENLRIRNIDSEMKNAEPDLYVAKNMGNEVLGCVYFKVHNQFWYKLAEIKHVVVKKSERRKKIGTEIIKEAEKMAIEKGSLVFQTAVLNGDKPIQKLLKSLRWKCGMHFYHLGETYYTYQKNLTGDASWLKLRRFSKSQ